MAFIRPIRPSAQAAPRPLPGVDNRGQLGAQQPMAPEQGPIGYQQTSQPGSIDFRGFQPQSMATRMRAPNGGLYGMGMDKAGMGMIPQGGMPYASSVAQPKPLPDYQTTRRMRNGR